MDWDAFELDGLGEHLRESLPADEAKQMLRAFEAALSFARDDPDLLQHLLAATVCLVAHEESASPRTVLETYFRRSVSDENWRENYLPLFD